MVDKVITNYETNFYMLLHARCTILVDTLIHQRDAHGINKLAL